MIKLSIKKIATLILLQSGIVASVALLLFMTGKVSESVSVLLAGVVAIVPQLIFATVHFRHRGARAAKKIANNFYKAEAYKIAVSIALFIMVFRFGHVQPLWFFVTYLSITLSFGFLLLIFTNKK